MADNNIIDLEKLPLVQNFDLSDEILAFREKPNGDYTMQKVKIEDLTPYFISNEKYTVLKAKYNELLSLEKDFYNFLNTKYPTLSYFKNNYTPLSVFNRYYNQMKTIHTVLSDGLEDYASIEYANYLKTRSNKYHEQLAKEAVKDNSTTLLELADITLPSSADKNEKDEGE